MGTAVKRGGMLGILGIKDSVKESVEKIPLEEIKPNSKQPRTSFSQGYIEELADSIKENGLLSPITVRSVSNGDGKKYEIVSGECRFRAYTFLKNNKAPNFEKIPAFIRNFKDDEIRVIALIENAVRRDLSLMDQALAFVEIKKELGSVDLIIKSTGKSKALIYKYLKIGSASDTQKKIIREQELSIHQAGKFLTEIDEAQKTGDKDAIKNLEEKIKNGDTSSLRATPAQNKNLTSPSQITATGESNNQNSRTPKEPKNSAEEIFWETEKEIRLNFTLKKNQKLNAKEQKNLIEATTKFFKAVGSKKVTIEF